MIVEKYIKGDLFLSCLFEKIVSRADQLGKLSGASVIIFVLFTTAFWGLGPYVKAVTAWRFGVIGVVKYELGTPVNGDAKPRTQTKSGRFFLLRSGDREFVDLRFGDVLQVIDDQVLREDNGCGLKKETDCKKSPRIFLLRKGQCVVVLSKQNADSGKDDGLHVNKQGGWVRVSTASCGLFN